MKINLVMIIGQIITVFIAILDLNIKTVYHEH